MLITLLIGVSIHLFINVYTGVLDNGLTQFARTVIAGQQRVEGLIAHLGDRLPEERQESKRGHGGQE